MARQASSFSIKLEGLEKASKIPMWLEQGQRRFFQSAVDTLAASVASKAPGGPGGSVGRSIKGRTLTATTGWIGSDHPGARALDRGAYLRGKRGQPLRFNVGGETVYARFVRLEPRRYFAKGLRYRNRIVSEAFKRHMGHLDRFGSG